MRKQVQRALTLSIVLLALGTAGCGQKAAESVETTAGRGSSASADSTVAQADAAGEAPEQVTVLIDYLHSPRETVEEQTGLAGTLEEKYRNPDWAAIPEVQDSAFPGLHRAVQAYMAEQSAALKAFSAEHQMNSDARYAGDVQLCRSDSRYLSFVRGTEDVIANAAGYTYDSQTGERLKLTDVITDEGQFDSALDAALRERDKAKLAEATKLAYRGDQLVWALGNEGLELYLSDPDSAYLFTRVVLSYERFPDLFPAAVRQRPAQYVAALAAGGESRLDGKTLLCKMVDTNGPFFVSLDGQEVSTKIAAGTGELDALLFAKTDEGDYLYASFIDDASDRWTFWELNLQTGETSTDFGIPLGSTGFNLQNAVNPESISLFTWRDTLSTLPADFSMAVRTGGRLEVLDAPYSFIGAEQLRSKQAFTFPVVQAGKETGETMEVPADSRYYFVASDGMSYVDFKLDGGQTVRVKIKRVGKAAAESSARWELENQTPEGAAFSGISYGG